MLAGPRGRGAVAFYGTNTYAIDHKGRLSVPPSLRRPGGRVYSPNQLEPVEYAAPSERTSKGMPVVNLEGVQLEPPNERVLAIVTIPNFEKGNNMVMATRKGMIKKTEFKTYNTPIKADGIIEKPDVVSAIFGQTEATYELSLGGASGEYDLSPKFYAFTVGPNFHLLGCGAALAGLLAATSVAQTTSPGSSPGATTPPTKSAPPAAAKPAPKARSCRRSTPSSARK